MAWGWRKISGKPHVDAVCTFHPASVLLGDIQCRVSFQHPFMRKSSNHVMIDPPVLLCVKLKVELATTGVACKKASPCVQCHEVETAGGLR